jgi:hypothetical protein
VNLWTGAPLAAVWVGSRVQASAGRLTMGAVGAVVLTFAVVEFALAKALASIAGAYDRLIGRPRGRRRSAWLRSMRDSRPHIDERDQHVSAIDALIVLAVICTMVAFEVWFFVMAGSPLPQGA